MEHTELMGLIKYTIEQTLSSIGFSLDDKKAIQEDLIYLRKKRQKQELIIKDMIKSIITFLIPIIFYCFWDKLREF